MKILKHILNWLISPFALGLTVTLGITYASYLYYDRYQDSVYNGESAFFDLVRELHQKSIDFRLLMRGPAPGSEQVAILAIDEDSLDQEGRWPWSREKIGRVVDRAIDLGAKVIAFDIIFSEEDSNSSIPTLKRLQQAFNEKQVLTPDLHSLFNTELDRADSDHKFGEIIKKHADHLVMGAYFEEFDKADLEIVSRQFDICIDALHERSPSYRYWRKDQRRPVIHDDHTRARRFAMPLKEHLDQYFNLLESRAIERWGESHPRKLEAILDGFEKLGLSREFPYAALLYAFTSKDPEVAAANIEQVTGETPPPELVPAVFDLFAKQLSNKDQAIIQAGLRQETKQYCFRFLKDDSPSPKLNDELLLESAFNARYENTNLAGHFSAISWAAVWEQANQEGRELPTSKFDKYLSRLRANPLLNQITAIDRWWLNIPVLEAGTKHTGFFNAHLDSDGTIRRNMFLARRGNNYATSLALTAFLVANDYSVSAGMTTLASDPRHKGIPLLYTISSENADQDTDQDTDQRTGFQQKARTPASKPATVAGFRILNAEGKPVFNVPVDTSGRMTINYSGPKHTFAHVSAADILNDGEKMKIRFRNVDPETGALRATKTVDKRAFLKDKILIFGATATGIFDLRVTPFEENFPGVETHANMLSNLIAENTRALGRGDTVTGLPGFLRTYPDREGKLMLAAMLVFGALLSAVISYFGSIAGLLITATSLASIIGIDKYVLFDSGIVVTVLLPIALVIILFTSLTFYKYFTEERTKRELKGTFQKYVSPAIVNEILSDPSNIELGGKKMELTVMFSDVRGFTTISEKLDPRALSDLLNSYLTPMTDLVFAHKGTLDKYMGDAIMAFWGAPIHFNDHAKHACRCALEMLAKLKELQSQYRSQGLPEIDIGIGLNTGEMSVGNMGSDTVRSYTVMGDAVNLGSRLEGINKQYGTRVIISEFTCNAVKDDFICREIDWVRVKGKALPVRIYELVAEKTAAPEKRAVLDEFAKGFAAYHTRNWNEAIAHFDAAIKSDPDDKPSMLYVARCREYMNNPPPENWDGVFTMTTK